MLVLSRGHGQSIKIGDNIEIFVTRLSDRRVSIGIDAPREVKIIRSEIDDRRPETIVSPSGDPC